MFMLMFKFGVSGFGACGRAVFRGTSTFLSRLRDFSLKPAKAYQFRDRSFAPGLAVCVRERRN